jgi:hypothetical protein
MSLEDAISDAIKTTGKGRGRNNCKYVLKNGETLRSYCIKLNIDPSVGSELAKIGYTPDEVLELLTKPKKGE